MLSIEILVGVYFLTGLGVGFGHCLAMCGPIVISISLNLKTQSTTAPLLLYNMGRVTMYGILGGIIGATGSFSIVVAKIDLLQQIVMVGAGLLIVAMGIGMSGFKLGIYGNQNESKLQSMLQKIFGQLSKSKSIFIYFPTGMVLGLLPCGPVYTALLAAGRTGMEVEQAVSAFIQGAILMLAFGLGTMPSLFIIGKLAGTGWIHKKDWIYKIAAIIMISLGLYYVVRGILV